MILGVFGDSFAASPLAEIPEGNHSAVTNYSWTEILRSDHNHLVRNFARIGTSLYWSYRQLQKNITQCQVVVFVATNSGRLYYPDPRYKIANLYSIRNTLNAEILSLPNQAEIYHAAEQYYLYLDDHMFNEFLHHQVMSEIKTLCDQHNKRLILIPGADCNTQYQNIFQCSLQQVFFRELQTQFGNTTVRKELYTRANHMCKENNRILAGIVDEILQNKRTSVTIDDFVYKKVNNPEDFWVLDLAWKG